MNLIAYLLNPKNSSMMMNVIKSHFLYYTFATAKTLSCQQLPLFNKYGKSINLLAATKFLLCSLDYLVPKMRRMSVWQTTAQTPNCWINALVRCQRQSTRSQNGPSPSWTTHFH